MGNKISLTEVTIDIIVSFQKQNIDMQGDIPNFMSLEYQSDSYWLGDLSAGVEHYDNDRGDTCSFATQPTGRT